jgi:Septation protein etd1
MFDCSQNYSPPHPDIHASDVHTSPTLSPKPGLQPALPAPQPPAYQPERTSLSPSEPGSTTFGSDNDRVFSSGDEDSMEFQSDTAYDSVSTRATMSGHPGLPGLAIERLFDDEPVPEANKHTVLPLEEQIPLGLFSESSQHDGVSLDGLESLSTPRDDHSSNSEAVDLFATPVAIREDQSQLAKFASSPPSTPYPNNPEHEQCQTDLTSPNEEDAALCSSELWDDEAYPEATSKDTPGSPDLPQHSTWTLSPPLLGAHQPPFAPLRQGLDDIREEKRLSIFDWSEQQRSERDSLNGSSPRPRTVHSKQSNDGRGGRAPGRRAPNALHLRSQSVPAAKESYLDSNPGYPPAKFGTWGLGNKGVSEEWTDDFEFDEVEECDTQHSYERLGTGMKVPQAIIDRQASVHGQFGQVQEFMLLVEELKRLRHQGNMLDLMEGPSHHLWEDAENIINLATLDEEDEELGPPQSPGFSTAFDEFDDDSSSPAHRPRQQYNLGFGDESKAAPNSTLNSAPATPAGGRPRGESLAQAKTFLQTMHQNRRGVESSPFEDRNHPPKLPFDTQDLRDLVARAGVATRALKEIVRKAEGVFTSPDRTPKEPRDPPFSQIFNRPETSPPTTKKPCLVKSTSVNSYISGSLPSSNNERDRAGHMNMMTVV